MRLGPYHIFQKNGAIPLLPSEQHWKIYTFKAGQGRTRQGKEGKARPRLVSLDVGHGGRADPSALRPACALEVLNRARDGQVVAGRL